MTLEWVQIRHATPKDVQDTQGSILYRAAALIPWYAAKALGSIGQAWNRNNLLAWDTPLPLDIVHTFQWYCGFKPEFLFLRAKPTFTNGDHYQLLDGKAVLEFFRQERNADQGVFAPGTSVTKIGAFISSCFPDEKLQEDDFILTAGPKATKLLHNLYMKKMDHVAVKGYFGNIKEKCASFLEELETDTSLNFSELIPQFFSEVFGENLLGNHNAGKELSSHIQPIKRLLNKLGTGGKLKPAEELELKKIQKSVSGVTNEVLSQEEYIRFFDSEDAKELSRGQKLAFLVVALFGASDNTTNLLLAAIYCLAIEKRMTRENLQRACKEHLNQPDRNPFEYPKELDQFLAKVIRYFPPVIGVARKVKAENGLCIEFRYKNEMNQHKVVIPNGSSLSARIYDAARNANLTNTTTLEEASKAFSPFGGIPQRCPGEQFAKTVILELLLQMVANYNVYLPGDYRIHQELQITSIIKPDVMACINKQTAVRPK